MEGLLSQYGLAGLVIGALTTVIVFLDRRNERLRQQIFDIQEERRRENEVVRDKLMETMSTFTRTSDLLLSKVSTVRRGRL